MAKPTKKPPTVDPKKINPDHYKKLEQYEPVLVIEATFRNDSHLAMAYKYMARAITGKQNSSYAEDVAKAEWWLHRVLIDCGHHPKD